MKRLPRHWKTPFPGSRLYVEDRNGRFDLQLQQHGLLCPLSAAGLSDGTLRYLLWTAALLSPRPLELLPALSQLILAAAVHTQIIMVSHAQRLIETLAADPVCTGLHLVKDFWETVIEGTTLFNKPEWVWPARWRGIRSVART
jgi:predicted ATPase